MYLQRLNYMLFCYIFPRPDGDLLVFVAPSRAITRQLAMASAPTAPTSCRARSPVSRVVAPLQLPVTHRRFIRTTDLLERLFVEESKAEDHSQRFRREAGTETNVRCAHRRHRALARPALLRVLAASARRRKKELDEEYGASTNGPARSSQPCVFSKSAP
jgi:hypothetical protein